MQRLFRKMLPIATAAACGALTVSAYGQYAVTTVQSLPYSGTDATSANTPVTYTSMSIPSVPQLAAVPEGGFTSPIVGLLTGTDTANSTVSQQTAFAYDPTNGFRLIGSYTETSTGSHSGISLKGVSNGLVIGSSPRDSTYSSSSGALGQDAWVYNSSNGVSSVIPLLSTFSSRTVSVGGPSQTYSSMTPAYVNSSGLICGISARYVGAASTTTLGTSAWVSNGTTTTEIGVIAQPGYEFTVNYGGPTTQSYTNNVTAMNSGGEVVGTTSAYADNYVTSTGTDYHTSLGAVGWVYNGSTSTPIDLYLNGSTPGVPGFSGYSYTYLTTNTGNTPNGQYHNGAINAVSANGQVAGYSQYFNGTAFVGNDGYIYTPAVGATAASYRQVGLISNGFTGNSTSGLPTGTTSYESTGGARSSIVTLMNATGQTAGNSSLYVLNPSGTVTTGIASFFDNAAGTTTRIGLFDVNSSGQVVTGVHTSSADGQFSTITNMTNSGFVAGFANRFVSGSTTGMGQDAWVYDSNSGLTYLLDPTDSAKNLYTSSTVDYLSESGVAVGFYSLGTTTASSSNGQNMAFLWSESLGFVPLNSDISPSLSAAGYQDLITAYFTDNGSTIYATANNSTTSNTPSALVRLSAVPEPAGLSFLFGLGVLLRRRRKM